MAKLDLTEIRAQLRAEPPERRSAPKGALGALRSLMGKSEPASLFTSPPAYVAVVRTPPPPLPDEDLFEPLTPEPRRSAFGQRFEAAPPPVVHDPIVLTLLDDADVSAAIHRLRTTFIGRTAPVDPGDIPFLPEDLADDRETPHLRALPAPPTRGEAVLAALEERLLAEQLTVIRSLAAAR